MAHETIYGRTVFDGGRHGIPCCGRAVAEGAPTKICRHNVYLEHFRLVLGVVAGLKNGELVMAG